MNLYSRAASAYDEAAVHLAHLWAAHAATVIELVSEVNGLHCAEAPALDRHGQTALTLAARYPRSERQRRDCQSRSSSGTEPSRLT